MAEAVRFELTMGANPRQFSRLVHSTTLPRLRTAEENTEAGRRVKCLVIFLCDLSARIGGKTDIAAKQCAAD